MESEEQVLGVLKRCEVCNEKTLHVGGKCTDHKVVRRRRKKRPALVAQPEPVAAVPRLKKKKKPRPSWFRRNRVTLVLLPILAIVGFLGFSHIVYGNRSGIQLCWKDGWTLSDTLVNLDDFDAVKGEGFTAKLHTALAQCGL